MEHDDSTGRREEIVSAAARLFAHRGYAGASLGMVADSAGIAKGAIYFNFRSKLELAQEVSRIQGDATVSAIQELSCSDISSIMKVQQLFKRLARLSEADPAISAGFRLALDVEMISHLGESYWDLRETLARWFRAAQVSGEVAPDIDAAELSFLVTSAFTGLLRMSWTVDDTALLEKRIDLLISTLLHGVTTR